MGELDGKKGWVISQVTRLIDLPRRDIQRCCYSGPGGVEILKPAESSWGKRFYSKDDIARLMLVKIYRDQGYSLPEIEEILGQAAEHDETQALLGIQEARLEEQLEETQLQLNRIRALRAATNPNVHAAEQEIEALLRNLLLDETIAKIKAESHNDTAQSCEFPSLENLLNTPGIDLLVDLWAGPGAFDAIVERLWDKDAQNSNDQ